MSPSEIRQRFLDFFASRGHRLVPSAPIVVKNDPTLMFTNAGMNQFKDWFLGNEAPAYSRVADTQKCLRVSGKHNDLEEVGVDTYHHTMFEMLGNWSFGDYFKKEAIAWAWELLIKEYGLPEDRLYVTVFEGDDAESLTFDSEAKEEWKKWLPEERILNGNKKDNFWEMGDTGPCGPCSEIHIDLRSDEERKAVDARALVNKDHPQVIEVWNLVFMEFNRKADGRLEPLPARHVDTGMGFERLCRAIGQIGSYDGKSSNYDTEVFMPLIRFVEAQTGKKLGTAEQTDIALRVLADHIRTISFAVLDGQLPSNNGAGYVIRRILRRAVRYYYSFLDRREPLLCLMVPVVAEGFRSIFPELEEKKEFIANVIREEENSFLRTLATGLRMIQEEKAEYAANLSKSGDATGVFSAAAIYPRQQVKLSSGEVHIRDYPSFMRGEFAFRLYDECGFPIDLTELELKEDNIQIEKEKFEQLLAGQKDRSRKATSMETGDWINIYDAAATEFVGYDLLEAEVKITRYRKVKAKGKDQFQLVFDKTPFYAESGGQVGDTGYIRNVNEKIRILDTQKENNLIIHLAERFPENPAAGFEARVDGARRRDTENNHSATHLLHAALRQVLGNHVEQKGSLVTADHLRFDFSHFKGLSPAELREVEQLINVKIRDNISLQELRSVPLEEAGKMGAMALFGEKYGSEVRVIVFDPDYSVELCGGTHVKATGQIGLLKIISENAVAAGVRRIEAVTASKAEELFGTYEETVKSLREKLKSQDIARSLDMLLSEKAEAEKRLEKLEAEKTAVLKEQLRQQVQNHSGANSLVAEVRISSAEQLKNLSFQLKKEVSNLFCVLGTEVNGKPLLSVIISEELVESKQLHAGHIVKELAREIKGGGGGQPFYATAGGNDSSGLKAALEKAKKII